MTGKDTSFHDIALAHLQNNQPKAIFYASEAFRQTPWNKEIAQTLEYLGTPYSPVELWSLRLPPGLWLSLAALGFFWLFQGYRQKKKRKIVSGGFLGLSTLALAVFTYNNSPSLPVVVLEETSLLSSPDLTARSPVILAKNTRTSFIKKNGGFIQIRLLDGKTGYLTDKVAFVDEELR